MSRFEMSGAHAPRWWLIIAALALLGCLIVGLLLGDVFETQHNAASL